MGDNPQATDGRAVGSSDIVGRGIDFWSLGFREFDFRGGTTSVDGFRDEALRLVLDLDEEASGGAAGSSGSRYLLRLSLPFSVTG